MEVKEILEPGDRKPVRLDLGRYVDTNHAARLTANGKDVPGDKIAEAKKKLQLASNY